MSEQNIPPATRTPGRRQLIAAWISVSAIPVGFILGMLLGYGLASALGIDEQQAPAPRTLLLVGLPSVALMVIPGIAAIVFGVRARRLGEPSGLAPAILGGIAALWAVLTNTLPVLLSGM